jgi:hypothetical protein
LMWKGVVNCPVFSSFSPLSSPILYLSIVLRHSKLEAEKDEEVRESRLYPREKLKYSSRFYV